MLLLIDNKYDNLYFNEDLIQKIEKISNKIKISLEKGKLIQNNWDEKNNKLNSLIYSCINIENEIKNINIIKEKISKYPPVNIEIIFDKEEKDINALIENIKSFGNINVNENILNKFIRTNNNLVTPKDEKVNESNKKYENLSDNNVDKIPEIKKRENKKDSEKKRRK